MTEAAAGATREAGLEGDHHRLTAGNRWLRHAQLAFLAFYFVRFLFPPIAWWEYVVNGLGLCEDVRRSVFGRIRNRRVENKCRRWQTCRA